MISPYHPFFCLQGVAPFFLEVAWLFFKSRLAVFGPKFGASLGFFSGGRLEVFRECDKSIIVSVTFDPKGRQMPLPIESNEAMGNDVSVKLAPECSGRLFPVH